MMFQEDNPGGITKADIIVGIPSYNEAANIAYPLEQASLGLKEYFPHMTSVIINCDNCSTDKTGQVFMNAQSHGIPKMYVSTPRGIRGRGTNLKNLFRKVMEMDAKAAVIIDASLKSVTPLWIKNLAEPVFKDFAFVAPLYVRHKYRLSTHPEPLRQEGEATHRRRLRPFKQNGRPAAEKSSLG
jgi:glycosyltransferase involved in cell wall biosynthesis